MKDKEWILATLWDIWVHVGASRDNNEPVDCDWVQATLLECKEAIEKQ